MTGVARLRDAGRAALTVFAFAFRTGRWWVLWCAVLLLVMVLLSSSATVAVPTAVYALF